MKYRLKDGVNFKLVNEISIMKYNFDLFDYYTKDTRIFEFPKGYVAYHLMWQVLGKFLIPLNLVEDVG